MLTPVRGVIRKKRNLLNKTIAKPRIGLWRSLFCALWHRVDAFVRHPFILLLWGFALSGVLGSYVTHTLDDQQRERESTVKGFDGVRSASDDLLMAVSEFQVRTLHLRDQIVANGPALQRAITDYEAAYVKWVQRSAADGAIIEQMYEGTTSSHDIVNYLGAFDLASALIDTCMRRYIASPQKWIDTKNTEVVCAAGPSFGRFEVSPKMMELEFCVRVYTLAVRPPPTLDFLNSTLRNLLLHAGFKLAAEKCPLDSAKILHPKDRTSFSSGT